MYVVLEGIDTAGKSTQLQLLKYKFPSAVFTKEPGGTKLGIKLREVILKNKNELVISDRSFISGIAYALDEEIDKLIELNRLATSNNFPQKVILLELSKEELEKRLSQKQNDSIEKRGIEYLLNIQKRLKETILKLNISYKFIDASLNINEIEKIIEDFINAK